MEETSKTVPATILRVKRPANRACPEVIVLRAKVPKRGEESDVRRAIEALDLSGDTGALERNEFVEGAEPRDMWCKPFVLLGSEDGRLEGRSTESLLGRFQAGEVDESYLVKQAITHISQSKRSERSVDEAPRSSLKESEDANMVTHVVKRTNVHLSEPPAEFVKSRKINILDLVGEEAPMSPRSPEKRERYPEIFDTQTTWSYAREDGFFTDYYVLGEVLPEELTRNCPAFTITYESFRQGILNETTLNNEYDGRESSSSTDTSEDSYLDYGEEDSSLSEHDGLYRNSFGYKSEKMSSFKYDPESASETTSSFEQDPESMSESDYPYFRLQ